jgi:hypothetical protein
MMKTDVANARRSSDEKRHQEHAAARAEKAVERAGQKSRDGAFHLVRHSLSPCLLYEKLFR